jgi:hypothetical protein
MDISFRKSRTFRAEYFFYGAGLFIGGITGYAASIPILGITLASTLLFFCWSFFARSPKRVYIIDVWIFAFLYMYSSEYILEIEEVKSIFGGEITATTEAFIVAAFGASLIGYVVSLRRRKKIQGSIQSAVKNPPDLRNRRPPVGVIAFFMLTAVTVVSSVMIFQSPAHLLFFSRAERALLYNEGSGQIFINAATATLPILGLYLSRKYRLGILLKILIISLAIFSISILYLLGTRFVLGFAASGILFYIFNGYQHIHRRQLLIIVICVIVGLAGQGILRSGRGVGNTQSDVTEAWENLRQPELWLSREGTLRMNAWVHLAEQQRYYSPGFFPKENLFLLYWWVPRSFWSEKPTMAEYWIVRELTDERGYSSNHSASLGFGGAALLDFGLVGGACFCLCYGLLLGLFEQLAKRYQKARYPESMIVSLLYFCVFFMMRSLQTSLVFFTTSVFIMILPMVLAEKIATKRITRRLRETHNARQIDFALS